MEPEIALSRIAYLLERDGGDAYRVAAFRRAIGAIGALSPAELEARVANHTLERLEGVGSTTARAVSEAVRGEPVAYLERLEAAAPPPPSGRVAELLARLRGDCHSHSDWSDGGSPIEEMARTAAALGRDYLVLTDHSPRLTVARGLSAERLEHQLDVVAGLNKTLFPFRLLTGIEVDILDDGSLDQDDALLERLDVVVASVHSKLKMDDRAMTRRLVAAVENPRVDILGHATGRLITGKTRPESRFSPETVFAACAASRTAVEINSRPDRRDPPRRLLELARDLGCLFSIDSDAHAPGQLEWLVNGCEQAVEADIPAASVINTFDLEHLLCFVGGIPRPKSARRDDPGAQRSRT